MFIVLFFIFLIGCSVTENPAVVEIAPPTTTIPISVNSNQVYPPSPNVFISSMIVGQSLTFNSITESADIFTFISDKKLDVDNIPWQNQNEITLTESGTFYLYGIAKKSGFCDSPIFMEKIFVDSDFTADNSMVKIAEIHNWATKIADYQVGKNCNESWQDTTKALGKAKGDSYDVVCLGDGGQVTVTFDTFICDGAGLDFAVFENSFSDGFLELAFVEVSSNGIDFERFDNCSLTECSDDFLNVISKNDFTNLASKYKQGFGTGFDLHQLIYRPKVLQGLVELNKISYVRIVDIVGDETSDKYNDSFGHHIYDPFPCGNISAGFDLDAVGVINWAKK